MRFGSTLGSLIVVGLAPLTSGCGFDAVVGGACRAGYVEVDGQCVPGPNGAKPASDTSATEPPSSTTSSVPSRARDEGTSSSGGSSSSSSGGSSSSGSGG